MHTKNVKKGESGIPAGDPPPLLAIEIGTGGIQQVLIYHDGDAIEEQTEAHLLLAKIMAQLVLLDDAVRTAVRKIAEPESN
jgi:hypothetical protein